MASESADSIGPGFTESQIINHTIDYDSYSYILNWRPMTTGSSIQLCGLRVFYTPPPFNMTFIPAMRDD